MKPATLKFIWVCAALGILMLAAAGAFYARFESLSDRLEQEMHYNGAAANAVKHAYAASQVYTALRFIHIGPEMAQETVIVLGFVNEYAERVVKFRKPDSVQEIMKDLHNNLAGIIAAEWHRTNAPEKTLLDIILAMAQNGTLVMARDQNPFNTEKPPSGQSPVLTARIWFFSSQAAIEERIALRLRRL